MEGKETDEEFDARRSQKFDEGMDRLQTFDPDKWEAVKKRMREKEEEETKRIFGDKKPTLYVDRYTDL
ncbi:hypothetical protein E0F15_04840 [Frankia sp. B2]|jgi:hypothetical protein|uniref:hypothetical protein n=1 Tax=Frankia sp. CeD TaxID=258230 RepID=UPI0004DD42A3|nr:hypothetical protein [Frankia sp. CeD]KEZ36045.1 hypothetical protein CEDDRAFT_02648 [Frankia sp. CeD]TFE33759.1 hypothetical protein E0F15_04840 [Frankia sp. B2]